MWDVLLQGLAAVAGIAFLPLFAFLAFAWSQEPGRAQAAIFILLWIVVIQAAALFDMW
ncbi:hypothetical protein H1W37_19410 [Stappia taiwanensis]|uniref:Uncharacterized protein n=1 Tax=Stappia taiwanensis TaxID=992267 RepID=A0A838XXN8_9HYPH|nr:hypothetical protein [Stappia taiwanensis]MBA4613831.1 hypothetical protein [Stappia taiwanensis]GGE79202.1 hypothetical protein GCM10007285_03770 [Stappia taiwanensis]